MIPMSSINVGTQAITLTASNQNAVIDTGTTLIGGPRTILDSLYSQVPGAAQGSSFSRSLADYYLVRKYTFEPTVCSHLVVTSEPSSLRHSTVVSLTFGGVSYQISPKDFIVDQTSTAYCLAVFFVLELNSGSSPIPGQSSSNPTWVVGDSFLKNVYTAFRTLPALGLLISARSRVRSASLGQRFRMGPPPLLTVAITTGILVALRVPALR